MFKLSIIGAGMILAIGTAQVNAEPPHISCSSFLKAKGSSAYAAVSDDAIDYIMSLGNAEKLFVGMSNCNLSDLVGEECK